MQVSGIREIRFLAQRPGFRPSQEVIPAKLVVSGGIDQYRRNGSARAFALTAVVAVNNDNNTISKGCRSAIITAIDGNTCIDTTVAIASLRLSNYVPQV